MEKVEKLLLYLVAGFPNRQKLSISRLVKMLYLTDWKNCLVYDCQMTDLEWYYNPDGPYVAVIQKIIESSNVLNLIQGNSIEEEIIASNVYTNIDLIQYFDFEQKEKEILNFVIEKTSDLSWTDFNKLIYSTFPIMKQPKYSILNLVELSREYLALKK